MKACQNHSRHGYKPRERTSFPNTWKTLGDRALLRKAVQDRFDVLVTNDRNMPYQQHLTGLSIAVLVLPNRSIIDAQSLAPRVIGVLAELPKSTFTILRLDGRAVTFDPSAPKS